MAQPDVLSALLGLLRSSHTSGPDELGRLAQAAGADLGADNSRIFVLDYDQVVLIPLISPQENVSVEAIRIEGTMAGRAFGDIGQRISTTGDQRTLWTPLLDGTERLGVWQLDFAASAQMSRRLLESCRDTAALLSELLLTRSLYGDLIERTRRRKALTVAAEIQWQILPPLTFIHQAFSIAANLIPATRVAGDSFDYALNGDFVHVAIFDAMGHGLEATLLAAVALSSLRNARRNGLDLEQSVREVDQAINAQFGPDKFVTAIIGALHTATGWWQWTTCGHPPALLMRGGRVVKTLGGGIGPPLGIGELPDRLVVGAERLEPGDRLLLYTDGVVDARDADGNFFGTNRLVAFVSREAAAGRPVAETLRRLNLAILQHQQGRLQDDATTVVLEWATNEVERSTIKPPSAEVADQDGCAARDSNPEPAD